MAPANTNSGRTDLDLEFTKGAGLVMLSLGQAVLMFTFWLVMWPSAFGVPRDPAVLFGLAAFFVTGALCGFYLGFDALSTRIDPGVERTER